MLKAKVYQRTHSNCLEYEPGTTSEISFNNYVIGKGKARNISEAVVMSVEIPPYTDVRIVPVSETEIDTKIHNGTRFSKTVKVSDIEFKSIISSPAIHDEKLKDNKIWVVLIPILCMLLVIALVIAIVVIIIKVMEPSPETTNK